MSNKRFYEVSVPVTVTVFVQGPDLDEKAAIDHAVRYASCLQPSEFESQGYSSVAFATMPETAVTRADVDVAGVPDATDTTDDQDIT